VKLQYEVTADQEYFNLVVNDEWVVRNFPLPPLAAVGDTAQIDVPINLGVPDGTAMPFFNYVAEMDSLYLSAAPSGTYLGATTETTWNIGSGEDGMPLTYPGPPPADVWQPGVPTGGEYHPPDSAVNQDCGENECAPAAISNSLKTLKKLHPTDMAGLSDDPGSATDDTDIDTMKPATGWDATGAPVGAANDPGAWWNLKAAWMDADADYPIDTTVSTDPSDVVDAINNGADVELRVSGHVVMVVGATQLPNGDVIFIVAHDTDQGSSPGHDGGTVIEPVYCDAATGTLYGSATFNGQTIAGGVLFVIEEVVVPVPDTTIEYTGSANFPMPLGAGTVSDPYWAVNTEAQKFTVTHITLGDVTSDPNTTYEVLPAAAGTLTSGVLTLDPAFAGTFTVSSQYLGQPSAPGVLHFTVYTQQPDSVFAWPAATTAHDGDHVLVTVYCYKTANPFLYLNMVRITAELGTTYVDDSLNVGAPGGASGDADGVWVDVDPADGFLGGTMGFEDIGGGRAACDFNITPINGKQIPSDASGALFNFEMEVHSDIHLGIDRGDMPKRTYYSDETSTEYFWAHDDNAGAPGITLVP
jgi:hypothetical protein